MICLCSGNCGTWKSIALKSFNQIAISGAPCGLSKTQIDVRDEKTVELISRDFCTRKKSFNSCRLLAVCVQNVIKNSTSDSILDDVDGAVRLCVLARVP